MEFCRDQEDTAGFCGIKGIQDDSGGIKGILQGEG